MIRVFVGIVGPVLLLSSLLAPHSSLPSARADEPKKEPDPKAKALKIRWFGQSFFQIETALGHKIAIDPHAIPAFGRVPVKADFVLITHPHDDHSVIEIIE